VIVARFGEIGEFDFRVLAPLATSALLRQEIEDTGSMHGLRVCRSDVIPALMLEMKSIHQDTALPAGSTPPQMDLQWMIQASKENFAGREAALASLDRVERRSLVLVTGDDSALDGSLTGREVRLGDRTVGFVQTDAVSYTLGRRIALAVVDDGADDLAVGSALPDPHGRRVSQPVRRGGLGHFPPCHGARRPHAARRGARRRVGTHHPRGTGLWPR
jgi:glycine cleavage system aminomethyltransferase T